jgi:uncharacterized HAD superfamily protein
MLQKNKQLKIGIDIDEVLVEFVRPYLEFHNQKFGKSLKLEEVKKFHFWEDLGFSLEEIQPLFEEFNKSFILLEDMPFFENAKESVLKLSENNEIFFITSRPEKIRQGTENFLKMHFANFKFINSGDTYGGVKKNKADICKENKLDLMIEDSSKIALECAQNRIKVFLMDKPWNQDLNINENILRVKNWKEIMKKIEEVKLQNVR